MKMNKILAAATLGILLGLLNACTWVKTTPEGESVRVASADAVSGCERKGKVTVSVKNRVSGVERKPTKVATELATLARNEGALLGGDTVVAETAVADGRQVFGVYRCGG
jgi:hypothetical protein